MSSPFKSTTLIVVDMCADELSPVFVRFHCILCNECISDFIARWQNWHSKLLTLESEHMSHFTKLPTNSMPIKWQQKKRRSNVLSWATGQTTKHCRIKETLLARCLQIFSCNLLIRESTIFINIFCTNISKAGRGKVLLVLLSWQVLLPTWFITFHSNMRVL